MPSGPETLSVFEGQRSPANLTSRDGDGGHRVREGLVGGSGALESLREELAEK